MDSGLAASEEAEAASFLNRPSSAKNKIQPLELEDDQDSMLPPEGRAPGLRHRKAVSENGSRSSASFLQGFVQGMLRQNIGSQFTFRNMFLLFVIAGLLFVAVVVLNDSTEHDFDGVKEASPHTSSFGGKNNPGIEHGSTGKYQRPPMIHDEDLPKSNVGQAVQSLSGLNAENHPGQYRHDTIHSPYASTLYAENVESEESRQQRQSDFDKRMSDYTARYGKWEAPLFPGDQMQTFYHDYWYKDVPAEKFPNDSWQANPTYMKKFLTQARSHVRRVQEAIYEEYGFGILDLDTVKDKAEIDRIKALRRDFMGVKVGNVVFRDGGTLIDGRPFRGVGYINRVGWEGLVRKLSHAIMTEDDFYVVVAGPPGATYEGVNLQMTQIMQFNDVMEPVMDRLGVRLISRNMGMNASSTVSALGGADIYGETDIFWYIADDSQMESDMQFDFLHKQMILSGERMPVILTPNPAALNDETGNRAWVGNIKPGRMGCQPTDVAGKNDRLVLPKVTACQYVFCTPKAVSLGHCKDDRTSPCWIDRKMTNVMTDEQLAQKPFLPRSPASLSYRKHQLEGRKLTLFTLEALDEALTRMVVSGETAQAKIFPTQSWHVGEVYAELRDIVRRSEFKIKPGAPANAPCEMLLMKLDPEICHMEMHAITEWTPRVTPNKNGLAIAAPVNGFVNETAGAQQLYEWFDLLPFEFMPGEKEVDVHMVSILGSPSGSRLLDQSVISDEGDGRDRRRLLRFLSNDTSANDTSANDTATEDTSVDGNLWSLHNAPVGFCDGSAQSWCNKAPGNDCLMGNVNFYKGGMLSRGTSDWLVLDIGEIREGIVLLRFEWSEEYGNGMVLPEDLTLYHSIDGPGGTVTSVNGENFLEDSVSLAHDLFVYPVLVNRKWSHNQSLRANVTLALRFETDTADFPMLLTHVYYA